MVIVVSCVLLGMVYLVSKADDLQTVTSGPWYNWLPPLLCIGAVFVGYPVSLLIAGINGLVQGISTSVKKSNWIKNAVSAQAPIVDRKEEFNDYAESREEMYDGRLALRLPAQISNEPNEQIVWVSVSQSVFEKYRRQSTARIYYCAAQPLMLIVEGE